MFGSPSPQNRGKTSVVSFLMARTVDSWYGIIKSVDPPLLFTKKRKHVNRDCSLWHVEILWHEKGMSVQNYSRFVTSKVFHSSRTISPNPHPSPLQVGQYPTFLRPSCYMTEQTWFGNFKALVSSQQLCWFCHHNIACVTWWKLVIS